jgi:hypothetical protein
MDLDFENEDRANQERKAAYKLVRDVTVEAKRVRDYMPASDSSRYVDHGDYERRLEDFKKRMEKRGHKLQLSASALGDHIASDFWRS